MPSTKSGTVRKMTALYFWITTFRWTLWRSLEERSKHSFANALCPGLSQNEKTCITMFEIQMSWNRQNKSCCGKRRGVPHHLILLNHLHLLQWASLQGAQELALERGEKSGLIRTTEANLAYKASSCRTSFLLHFFPDENPMHRHLFTLEERKWIDWTELRERLLAHSFSFIACLFELKIFLKIYSVTITGKELHGLETSNPPYRAGSPCWVKAQPASAVYNRKELSARKDVFVFLIWFKNIHFHSDKKKKKLVWKGNYITMVGFLWNLLQIMGWGILY